MLSKLGVGLTALGIVNLLSAFGPVLELHTWLENVITAYRGLLTIVFYPFSLLGLHLSLLSKTMFITGSALASSARYYRRLFIRRRWHDSEVRLSLLQDAVLFLMLGLLVRQRVHDQVATNSDPLTLVFMEGALIGLGLYFMFGIVFVVLTIARISRHPERKRDRKLMWLSVRDYVSNLTAALIVGFILLALGAKAAYKF